MMNEVITGHENKEILSNGHGELMLIQKSLGFTLDLGKFRNLKVVKKIKSTFLNDSHYNAYSQTAFVESNDVYPEVLSDIEELEELKESVSPTSIHEVMHAVNNCFRFGDIKGIFQLDDPHEDILISSLKQRLATQTTLADFIVDEGFAIHGENKVHDFITCQLLSNVDEMEIGLNRRLFEQVNSIRQMNTSRREEVSVQRCLNFLDFIDNFLFEDKLAENIPVVGDLVRYGILYTRFGLRWEDVAYKCAYLYVDGLTKNGDNNIIDILRQDTPTIGAIRKIIMENSTS